MTSKNSKALRNGEKSLRPQVPIRFNDWSLGGSGSTLKDAHKDALVKFTVLTHNLGVGGRAKAKDMSCGSKTLSKVDRIEDNPKAIIETWQGIFNELLPSLIDVDPISAVELFQAHLTGIALKEFQEITFQSSWKLYNSYISVNHNERIAQWGEAERTNSAKIASEFSQLSDLEQVRALETKKWIQQQNARKAARQNAVGVADYTYEFPPPKFPHPPKKPSKGHFVDWSVSGINAMSACAWLRQHNHGWEYAQKFLELSFNAVQHLAFKIFGARAGKTQMDYLRGDLKMDPTHSMKVFYRLLQAHSEAQPYYPTVAGEPEVGQVFTEATKIEVVWNACHELFKDELTNMNITRLTDFGGKYETCKEQFLLAEERRAEKGTLAPAAKATKPKEKSPNTCAAKGLKKDYGSGKTCSHCGKGGHSAADCFNNPRSQNYKGGDRGGNKRRDRPDNNDAKRRRANPHRSSDGTVLSYEEWEKKAKYDAYVQDCAEQSE